MRLCRILGPGGVGSPATLYRRLFVWRVATAGKKVLPWRNVSFSKKWVLCKSTLPLFFVLVRFLFLYRGSIIKKKNRGSGGRPLEVLYCGRIWVKLKGRGGGARWWHRVAAPPGATTWCHHPGPLTLPKSARNKDPPEGAGPELVFFFNPVEPRWKNKDRLKTKNKGKVF